MILAMNIIQVLSILKSRGVPYAVAVLAAICATAIQVAMQPMVGDQFPFATLFLAVLVSAGIGGLGPGIVATVCGYVAAAFFLMAPRGSIAVHGSDNQFGMLVFVFVSTGITLLA